jgi:hypothetical protein
VQQDSVEIDERRHVIPLVQRGKQRRRLAEEATILLGHLLLLLSGTTFTLSLGCIRGA